MVQITASIRDDIGTTDLSPVSAMVSATDGFRCVPVVGLNMAFRLTLSEAAGLSEAMQLGYGHVVHDALALLDSGDAIGRYGELTVDTLQLAAALSISLVGRIDEGFTAADVAKSIYVARVLEKLGLSETYNPKMLYGLRVIDGIRLADQLRRFFAGEVVEGVQFTDTSAGKPVFGGVIAESLGLTSMLNQQLILRVTCADGFYLDHTDLVNMVYSGVVADDLQIAATYIEPNGSTTTWAVNTRTAAVTEYSNFNFNSFAPMGFKYLGAADDGLYELDGDTDAGESIIAKMKNGFSQFGGMHLNTIKGIYLGVRGGGDFLLKIEDGAGHVTTYGLKARDFETTRVRTGKGLRARFFRFELISTGQDFDLEAIEFIPLVAQRRG